MIRKANISLQYRSKNEVALLEVRMSFKDENNKWKSFYTRSQIEVSKKFWDEHNGYYPTDKDGRFIIEAYYDKDGREKERRKYIAPKRNFGRDSVKANLRLEINNTTQQLQEFISKRLETNTQPITSEWLKSAVDDYYLPPVVELLAPTELIPFFDYFLNDKISIDDTKRSKNVKTITMGTYRAYRVVRNKIEAFQSDTGRVFNMTDINISFLKEFQEWSLEMGYSNSVVNKNVSQIKTLCRYAESNDIEIDNRVYSFVGIGKSLDEEIQNVPVITLSFAELEILQSLELNSTLDNVRDWLIISCFTGQRISDFKRFKPSMIKANDWGRTIEIRQQKTGKYVTIPLLPQVEAILKKRNNKFPDPIIDQRYNDDVKIVCRKAGISEIIKGKVSETTQNGVRRKIGEYKKWQLVTSHIGRRSFATNFYGVMHTAKLKDLTGHSTEAMLLEYVGVKSRDQQDKDDQTAYEAMIKRTDSTNV